MLKVLACKCMHNYSLFPRQGFPVPHELLPPHIGCCQSSATSIFQPPPSRRTMATSSQHARPSGVLRRRSHGLERAAWRPPRPVAQWRHFQEEAQDASVSECTWTLSALEALRNALYTFKTYLLTFSCDLALHGNTLSTECVCCIPSWTNKICIGFIILATCEDFTN